MNDLTPIRILVDIDDTIENLLEAWVEYLNNKYHLCVNVNDCDDWDITKLFTTLTEDQIYSVLGEEELWKTVRPKEGAMYYLQTLQEEGFDIVLVTASTYFNIRPKIEHVINKYFPFIYVQNIIVTNRKQMIDGDILIDDYIENLRGGKYRKVLFSSIHNRDICLDKDIIRIDNWRDIYHLIHFLYD